MYPTEEQLETNGVSETTVKAKRTFKSLDQFSLWLDSELDVLVSQYKEFETDTSVCNFFKR